MKSTGVNQAVMIQACLLGCDARFSNYQEIPEFIRSLLNVEDTNEGYEKDQLSLDGPRYRFLEAHLELRNRRVTEIGSNLGYFGLRLVHEYGCQYVGYEPLFAYSRAADMMAEISGLNDHCRFVPELVGIDSIPALSATDLIIELNVLHHAGAVFDSAEVQQFGGWRGYAVERLGRLRDKGRALLFQTGNVADGEALFPTEEAVEFTYELLSEAGWNPHTVGTVDDLNQMDYVSRPKEARHAARTYVCRRDPKTGLVDYHVEGNHIGSVITGLANRPIWICD